MKINNADSHEHITQNLSGEMIKGTEIYVPLKFENRFHGLESKEDG